MAGPNSDGRRLARPRTPREPVEALFGGRAIVVRGAREHNLKNVDLTIPRDKLVVFTGLSGSGKSSLAFDTIYAEGQRRYVESLSAYARQFLEMMQKPDVDQIDGLSPAIAIEQKTTSKNPRSTVGTVTEIHDYMRLLWARVGIPYSPATGLPDREPDGEPDGRPGAGAAGAHAALSARAGRARPEGRVPQGNRRLHEARLPAAEDRRPVLRDRRRAGARQEAQARHRGRRRPHRRPARHGARGSPRASRPRSSSPTASRWSNSPTRPESESGAAAHPVLVQVRLSGLRLHHRRDRAEAVLVQQSVRRLPGLRRAWARNSGSTIRSSSPTRSSRLRQGAIAPWAKSSSPYYLQTLEALARHYKFRLDKPWSELPDRGAARDPARLGRGRDPLRL